MPKPISNGIILKSDIYFWLEFISSYTTTFNGTLTHDHVLAMLWASMSEAVKELRKIVGKKFLLKTDHLLLGLVSLSLL